ncbi:MAG: DUF2218 domain-containing protein [Rhodoferax sp.]|nr:DUF2218 domain-containing protein [Rhodoferax sp.]
MNYASTNIPTADAAKYILKLCRHFAHKVQADFTEREGRVQFLQGQCVMKGDVSALCVYLQAATADGIQSMQFIIDDHLQRFVRFETLSYQWGTEMPQTIQRELEAIAQTGSAT